MSTIAVPSAVISFERLIVSPAFAVAAAVLNSFQVVTAVVVFSGSAGNLNDELRTFCKIKATSSELITPSPFTSTAVVLKSATELGLRT